MAMYSVNDQELFLYSVDQTLKNKVFEILKAPLMELAEREIDKEVQKAVDEMNTALESFQDRDYMRTQINVLYAGRNGRT